LDHVTFEPCAPHAGAHPFDDQVAFEFGDGADDHHNGAAQRAARVDLLTEADELDVQSIELVEHLQEVPRRAGDRSNPLPSLEQIAIILYLALNRWQHLVAANDKAWIPGMLA